MFEDSRSKFDCYLFGFYFAQKHLIISLLFSSISVRLNLSTLFSNILVSSKSFSIPLLIGNNITFLLRWTKKKTPNIVEKKNTIHYIVVEFSIEFSNKCWWQRSFSLSIYKAKKWQTKKNHSVLTHTPTSIQLDLNLWTNVWIAREKKNKLSKTIKDIILTVRILWCKNESWPIQRRREKRERERKGEGGFDHHWLAINFVLQIESQKLWNEILLKFFSLEIKYSKLCR